MTDSSIWDQEVAVPETVITYADPNVVEIIWGSYANEPNTYFFLCEFHKMTGDVPDVLKFPGMLAQMHKTGVSPSGRFGFPDTTECDTWEESFSRGIRFFSELEKKAQGYEEEMVRLRQIILETVMPQLLRPFETEGRTVVPCLIHGDLWDGNTSVDAVTGNPVIFDACASYVHQECKWYF
ncbi:hypothetical protein BU23DRAFT_586354 [Bimuria novae-zelandiae CBS 107.79]|uniref:protein-ribulosamine 3-kinase n=1 Tax=Bimuria novae-zelandiae CBS 107.79 TaxID=1447943 RepID=A0A6A5VQ53_9PLEO|nr:hypothetical protein BU23DRAFT_586354 [Bimuria novae-zelandiae CBS 107.79]